MIRNDDELELAEIERDKTEIARRRVGAEIQELDAILEPIAAEQEEIRGKLMRSAWPQGTISPEVVPVDEVIEQTRNKVGQVVTTRRFRPRWPKRPPAFVIDRELRRTLFARLDRLADDWRAELTRRHDLGAEYRRLMSDIEALDDEIAKYRAKPPKPPKKPKGGDGQPRLI